MAVVVHSHGIHYRWLRDLPEELRQEIRRAHDLREDLVTLELQFEEDKKAIWSGYPQVAATESALAAAEEEAADAAPPANAPLTTPAPATKVRQETLRDVCLTTPARQRRRRDLMTTNVRRRGLTGPCLAAKVRPGRFATRGLVGGALYT